MVQLNAVAVSSMISRPGGWDFRCERKTGTHRAQTPPAIGIVSLDEVEIFCTCRSDKAKMDSHTPAATERGKC